MKFIHMADMHFDAPFRSLDRSQFLGEQRRIEQREAFSRIVEYIKENQITYLFISGDLYEQEYIKRSTIEYIVEKLKEIPDTHIFIAPGNHDPYLKNSYYQTYSWPDNVHIFGPTLERIETKDAVIYGFGFSDFYCKDSGIHQKIEEQKPSILVMHGSVDSGKVVDQEYNPLTSKEIEALGFDYIALGHIHKKDSKEDRCWHYPGSTISMGFDELGNHGVLVGEVQKGKREIRFLKIDSKEYIEKRIDISDIYSQEALYEAISYENYEKSKFYKIILEGTKNFEVDILALFSLLQIPQILKIRDETKLNYSLESIAKEQTLKGIFIKNLLEKLQNSPEKKQRIEKAIQYGLDSLEG